MNDTLVLIFCLKQKVYPLTSWKFSATLWGKIGHKGYKGAVCCCM